MLLLFFLAQADAASFFFLILFIIYFWLHWVFVAARRLSLVVGAGATICAVCGLAVASLVAELGL